MEIFLFLNMENDTHCISHQVRSLNKGCIPKPSQVDPQETYILADGFDFDGNRVQINITGESIKKAQRVLRGDALKKRNERLQQTLLGSAFYFTDEK